jgi:hypothetical protein
MGRLKATADLLGLQRDIIAVSAAMFLMGLGENLWRRFLPKYLEVLGAPVTAIGLFGATSSSCRKLFSKSSRWRTKRPKLPPSLRSNSRARAWTFARFATR